ncbi:hypothetical protein [Paraburkholderia kururiensis]|uniref:Uncharacterized protein n=1 Tax=Paraburkholderia kururiensis TaxID=984307 RepID=A0ABZ0WU84_9BURK|nr:hypothetical protein U0042_14565 [Paraburkholderia kururiensis]
MTTQTIRFLPPLAVRELHGVPVARIAAAGQRKDASRPHHRHGTCAHSLQRIRRIREDVLNVRAPAGPAMRVRHKH